MYNPRYLLSRLSGLVLFAVFLPPAPAQTPAIQDITPTSKTSSVANDADDPAIWVNRRDPSRSLILGTNKVSASEGGSLYVFDLNGKTKQVLGQLDRPNNVDIEYGLILNGIPLDIAVVTERNTSKLRFFYIRPDGSGLKEIGQGVPILAGETPQSFASPMGIALYKRPQDKAIFAIVSRKSGPKTGYLFQYRLSDNGRGGIGATLVRKFGNFSGNGEIEAVAVDDALGYVYYADETFGIRKWHADPDHPDANQELTVFGKTGYKGDREGIAFYTHPDGTGYIICADQIAGNSLFYVYKREGEPGRPHDHSKIVAVFRGGADETDGIEMTSTPLDSAYSTGLFATMNNKERNFLLFDPRKLGMHP